MSKVTLEWSDDGTDGVGQWSRAVSLGWQMQSLSYRIMESCGGEFDHLVLNLTMASLLCAAERRGIRAVHEAACEIECGYPPGSFDSSDD